MIAAQGWYESMRKRLAKLDDLPLSALTVGDLDEVHELRDSIKWDEIDKKWFGAPTDEVDREVLARRVRDLLAKAWEPR